MEVYTDVTAGEGNRHHERRAYSRELKFLLEASRAPQLADWVRSALDADEHGGGRHGDEYTTTTLYFDTASLDVWQRNGSFGRSKLRIRRYGDDGIVFLERKLRTDEALMKRRTAVPVHALARLAGDPERGWEGYWFHKRLARRGLIPSCQVSYRRIARAGETEDGPVRITIDTDLRAVPARRIVLSRPAGLVVLPGHAVVEIKFASAQPALLRQLIGLIHAAPQTVSKYRLAAAVLNPQLRSLAV